MKIYRSIKLDSVTGEVLHEDSYDYYGPVATCDGGGSGGSKTYTPQESGADAVEMEIPDWVKNISPTLEAFYKKAIGDKEYPYSINSKAIQKAINTMGRTLYSSVLNLVNEPYDLFQIDINGYMDTAWQSLIDWGASYDPKITGSATDTTISTTVGKPTRRAFQEYAPDLKKRFTKLAGGEGYAQEEMEAMFRKDLKEIETRTSNRLEAINRLSGSDPRLRKSALMDLEISRGGWEQDARDKNMARQAEMRLKSEFFGTEGLLSMAKLAVDEETDFNKINLLADQLKISKEAQEIGFALEQDRMNIEAQRIAETLKFAGKDTLMNALQGKLGLETAKGEGLIANEGVRMNRLNALSSLFGSAEDIWRYGKNYQLNAATGGTSFMGQGLDYALNKYAQDIGRYRGGSVYTSSTASKGPLIGGLAGMGLGGGLGFLAGGPIGALLGVGLGGTAGRMFGGLWD